MGMLTTAKLDALPSMAAGSLSCRPTSRADRGCATSSFEMCNWLMIMVKLEDLRVSTQQDLGGLQTLGDWMVASWMFGKVIDWLRCKVKPRWEDMSTKFHLCGRLFVTLFVMAH